MIKNITNIPNHFFRVSIKGLILDGKKRFLLTLEKKGLWDLPGGGLNFGEKPLKCLAREIKEEMGLEVIYINERPSYFITAHYPNGYWKAHIIYEAKIKNLRFIPSDECIEIRFFTKAEASEENLQPAVKKFIKEYNPNNHKGYAL